MEQYINKSALVAEIKARISDIEVSQKAGLIKKRDADMKITLFKSILSLLDTTEAKEVDLEKEIDFVEDKYHGFYSLSRADIIDVAKHFFELGLRSTITEKDCKLIWNIGDDLPYMSEEEFFKELLRRYKAQKGEEV